MFDGIGDFLGSEQFSNAVPIVGPLLNYFGQDSANKQAQANAEHQMRFQEYMSNTAYQRAVKDLKAAGLNPMLAYMKGGGGASTPSGATSVPQSTTREGVNTAISGALAREQMANMRENNALLRAQQQKTAAETSESFSRTAVNWADESLKGAQRGHSMTSAEELMSRMGQQALQNRNISAEFHRIIADTQLKTAERNRVLELAMNAVKERQHIIERTGSVAMDTVLKKLEVPLARNLARAEESAWKENYSPYLRDVGSVMSGTYRAKRMFQK